jgi:hypothetical protein
MRSLLALVVILAQVAGTFTDATAEGSPAGEGRISVELSVGTDPGGVVVVHLVGTDGAQSTVSMVEVTSGRYTAVTEIDLVDMVVVFEAVSTPSYRSTALTLTEMGLDPALLGMTGPAGGDGESDDIPASRNPWWLALAGVTVAGAAAAIWLLGRSGAPRRGRHRRAG